MYLLFIYTIHYTHTYVYVFMYIHMIYTQTLYIHTVDKRVSTDEFDAGVCGVRGATLDACGHGGHRTLVPCFPLDGAALPHQTLNPYLYRERE